MVDFTLMVSFLAFLTPLAVYCLVLALVNRRTNPVMVSGVWDSLGLFLGLSGLLFVSAPWIVFHRNFGVAARNAIANQMPVQKFMEIWWLLWIAYYWIVLGGAVLLVWLRRHKTVIYNVDPVLFTGVLDRSLKNVGLQHTRLGKKVFLREWDERDERAREPDTNGIPGSAFPVRTGERDRTLLSSEGERVGQVDVDPFHGMSNVTLHWRSGPPRLRVEIEDELRRNLDACRTLDNPASGWFLGLSSMFFGFVMLASILLIVLPHG